MCSCLLLRRCFCRYCCCAAAAALLPLPPLLLLAGTAYIRAANGQVVEAPFKANSTFTILPNAIHQVR